MTFLDKIDDPVYQATDLSPCAVVASNAEVQLMMDDKQIAWGVQWELARGIAIRHESGQTQRSWSWSDITREKLDKLKGKNADAAWKVQYVMRDEEIPGPPANRELW